MLQKLAKILSEFSFKFKMILISLFFVMLLQSFLELLGIGFFVSLVFIVVLGMEPVSSSISEISSLLETVAENSGVGILFVFASAFFIVRAFIQFLSTGIIYWLQYDTERLLVNRCLKAATNQERIENINATGIGAISNLILKEGLQVGSGVICAGLFLLSEVIIFITLVSYIGLRTFPYGVYAVAVLAIFAASFLYPLSVSAKKLGFKKIEFEKTSSSKSKRYISQRQTNFDLS